MSEDAIAEAEKYIERIRTLDVRIASSGSAVRYEHEKKLLEAIDDFTRSRALKDRKALDFALTVIEEYTWMATNDGVHETNNVQLHLDNWKKRAGKLEEEKKQLKEDLDELIEKYYKLEGKSEYITAEFEKLMSQLADSWKKAHQP